MRLNKSFERKKVLELFIVLIVMTILITLMMLLIFIYSDKLMDVF